MMLIIMMMIIIITIIITAADEGANRKSGRNIYIYTQNVQWKEGTIFYMLSECERMAQTESIRKDTTKWHKLSA